MIPRHKINSMVQDFVERLNHAETEADRKLLIIDAVQNEKDNILCILISRDPWIEVHFSQNIGVVTVFVKQLGALPIVFPVREFLQKQYAEKDIQLLKNTILSSVLGG